MKNITVYLEKGKKKTFACAIDWPGWTRSGSNEQSALRTLYEYGSRYAEVLDSTKLDYHVPENPSVFVVVERLEGNTTTDFGAPGMAPTSDLWPVDNQGLMRFQELLTACWDAFDAAARNAAGQDLRKGPRGGGRDLEKMVNHVMEADLAYLRKIGWKYKKEENSNPTNELRFIRKAIFEALTSAVNGDLPAYGSRGGRHWNPRYFVRRIAWHVLDHAWEIEDRIKCVEI